MNEQELREHGLDFEWLSPSRESYLEIGGDDLYVGDLELIQKGNSKIDTSRIRGGDVPYVLEVIDYLTESGLDVRYGGSDLNSNKREQGIDLIAEGSLAHLVNAASGLAGSRSRVEPFMERSADGLSYSVRHEKTGERFNIRVGGTEIDLQLKVKKAR